VHANIEEWTAALQLLEHKIELLDEWITSGKRPAPDEHSTSASSATLSKRRSKGRSSKPFGARISGP
jgi:hypothetical protein